MTQRSFVMLVVILAGGLAALVTGCDSSEKKGIRENNSTLCQPQWCDGGCGDDGCGGTCGCQTGAVCNAASQCVAPAECTQTCQAAGYECGTLCGASCGTCGTGQQCFWHKCYTPPVAESCGAGCSLRLSLVSKEVDGDNLTKVVLAIDYAPTEHAARMADLWLYANAELTLDRVETGPGLTSAGKSFFVDPVSHNLWRKRADRSFQLLALSLSNTNPIASGRLATLEFTLKTPSPGPVPFKLLHHPTFAPSSADNELAGSGAYDSAIVVTAK